MKQKKPIEICIAVGRSCKEKVWNNEYLSFDEFCNRIKLLASMNAYNTKDVGGYVGGRLKKNGAERKKENIAGRSLWTADLDNVTKEFMDEMALKIPFRCIVHSTYSYTKTNPRLRLIAPFNREVTPDEYTLIATYLTNLFGKDMFDNTDITVNQMMFWPSRPKDSAPAICEDLEGDAIDVDKMLHKAKTELYPDLAEQDLLEVQAPIVSGLKNKRGVIGAFNRAYTIPDAIKRFLYAIYEPTDDPNRYKYVGGSSPDGLWIHDDIAYSHHESDPAKAKARTAFDLVCLHIYRNSVRDAIEYLKDDFEVKKQLMKEGCNMDNITDLSWVKKLKFTANGKLEEGCCNLSLILENDPRFKNFAYNRLSRSIEVTGELPWDRPEDCHGWLNSDTDSLKHLIEKDYRHFTNDSFNISLTKVSSSRMFHPILDYLNSLPEWDGTPRIDTLLIDKLGATDSEYVRAVSRKTLVAAIARITNPGCKFDHVLVLDGLTGIGKSSLFKALVGDRYYSDTLSLTDMYGKTAAEKLQGNWIVEIAELAGMKKADIEKVKSFITVQNDKYRPAYGRFVESHPRQCIMIATVNGDNGYLRDMAGNRRFWIVKLSKETHRTDWGFTKEDVDQIWAEAKHYYEQGEKIYLEGDLLLAAEEEQRKALECDEREAMVEGYLNAKLPKEWENMNIMERRNFIKNHVYNYTESDRPMKERDLVCISEIWCECFCKEEQDLSPKDSNQIAKMIKRLGWEPTKKSERVRQYIGKHRTYKRGPNAVLYYRPE